MFDFIPACEMKAGISNKIDAKMIDFRGFPLLDSENQFVIMIATDVIIL